jgi:hypothetical protein
MWTLQWKGRCRVYFNAHEEAPLIWSVDDGNIRTEIKATEVCINVIGFQTGKRIVGMPEQPKVWLEIHHTVAVYQHSVTKVISIRYE